MKDTLTSQNWQDFRKRYEGTYGSYSHNLAKPIMVCLSEVGEERVTFLDKNGQQYHANSDTGIPFEFYPVERKLVNTPKGHVVYFSRKPAQQWKRGICSQNTAVRNLSLGGAISVNFTSLAWMRDAAVDTSESVAMFLKGEATSVALNNTFCILGNTAYIYNLPVGTYEKGTAKIHSLYRQEFLDVVSRNNFPIKVEPLNV